MTAWTTFTAGSVLNAAQLNDNNYLSPPIGSIIGWAKNITGIPALDNHWVECNGQTLSDAASPLNGQVIPNLNASGGGTQRFLRGATTSGTVGGEDSHILTVAEMPAHNHTGTYYQGATGGSYSFNPTPTSTTPQTATVVSQGGGSGHENKPPYFEVVWIMKVK